MVQKHIVDQFIIILVELKFYELSGCFLPMFCAQMRTPMWRTCLESIKMTSGAVPSVGKTSLIVKFSFIPNDYSSIFTWVERDFIFVVTAKFKFFCSSTFFMLVRKSNFENVGQFDGTYFLK